MIAFIWLYLAGIGATTYGTIGFVREIARVAPGNPSMHYAWWILGGLTLTALAHALNRINSNILTHDYNSKMRR